MLASLLECVSDVTDPTADVMKFIRTYEETYGNQHPVFYQGSYSQALNDAKNELRFLVVYLHSDDHQDNITFCRLVPISLRTTVFCFLNLCSLIYYYILLFSLQANT